MRDAAGARARLRYVRPGAWLVSPFYRLEMGEMAERRGRVAPEERRIAGELVGTCAR
jgi:hypothetical protein